MTTRMIQDVLEAVAGGGTLTHEAQDAAIRALAELAAIRAAAKHVSEGEGDEALRNCGEDYDAERSLFDAIAREGT